MFDSESELDKIFLSYNKILARLNKQGCKTKNGKEITHKDLRQAINEMTKKHLKCRWKSNKIRSKRFYILIEGYWWLVDVYFQNERNILDADIDFFKMRIAEYEKILGVEPKELFKDNILYSQVDSFFDRKIDTIRKVLKKIEKQYDINLRFEENSRVYVSSKGIELLCKEYFKQKYLEILENYKMELTEKYIEAGYPYDNFFHRN